MSSQHDAETPLDPPMIPHETRKDNKTGQTLKEQLAQTNPPTHREEFVEKQSTSPAGDEKHIGQHTGAGKPPLMKK
ncbi:MAG: hypothetical protein H7Y38_20915 [Armatimonadetes bacterium]|nr:hypothetical protein [Armatimonadota bacterium]